MNKYRSITSNFTTTMVCKEILKEMLPNCPVLYNFKSVLYSVDSKVKGNGHAII